MFLYLHLYHSARADAKTRSGVFVTSEYLYDFTLREASSRSSYVK